MSTVIIKIVDEPNNHLSVEGLIDNPEALNEPPTAASIIGAYVQTNMEQVCKDAVAWFNARVAAAADPEPAPQEPQLKLVLPGDGGQP